MKAIPTTYKGTTYRSRLEARWQVYFDALGFISIYEPFVLENNNLEWTPDFIVMSGFSKVMLIEIKPIKPNDEYINNYLMKLRNPSNAEILICVGEPTLEQPNGVRIRTSATRNDDGSFLDINVRDDGFFAYRCDKCGRYNIDDFDEPVLYHYGFCINETNHPIRTSELVYAKSVAEEFRFDL